MSRENVDIVRQPIAVKARSRRSLEDRLVLRFPRLRALVARAVWRLPPPSRLRRTLLRRVVQLGIAATNRADYEVAFALHHPDVELITPPQLVGLGEKSLYRGRAERIGFQRKWTAEWEVFSFGPDEILDLGDRVLLLGRMAGSGLSSGAAFESEWANLLAISAGRVIREQYFPAHAQALEAAGLSE